MAFSGGLEGSERETAFHKQWTMQESEFGMQNRSALTNRNQRVLPGTWECVDQKLKNCQSRPIQHLICWIQGKVLTGC